MKKRLLYYLFVCLLISLNTKSHSGNLPRLFYSTQIPFSQTTFNVKDYGAKADGKSNDALAINKAIAAAAKAGGGIVFFRPVLIFPVLSGYKAILLYT